MDGQNICKLQPDVSLRDYIQSYTFINIPYEQASQLDFWVMPASHSRMIFFLGEASLQKIDGKFERIESNGLSGFYSMPHLFVPTQSLQQVIIQFTPWGVQPLLDFPLSDITDTRADLQFIFKSGMDKLRSGLLAASDTNERKRILDAFFVDQYRKTKAIDQRIKALVQNIGGKHGNISLDQLSRNAFLGERTIQRIVHSAIGINYKFFTKLIRLEYVRALLGKNEYSLHEVALKAGYFDQAHFIHEFQSVYGESPRAFHKRQNNQMWNQVESKEPRQQ